MISLAPPLRQEFSMCILKLNVKRALEKSMFIEGLPLLIAFCAYDFSREFYETESIQNFERVTKVHRGIILVTS